MYMYIYMYLSLSLHIYIYIYTHVYVCMHICIYIYIYTYVCIYIYIWHVYTCNTQSHSCTLRRPRRASGLLDFCFSPTLCRQPSRMVRFWEPRPGFGLRPASTRPGSIRLCAFETARGSGQRDLV